LERERIRVTEALLHSEPKHITGEGGERGKGKQRSERGGRGSERAARKRDGEKGKGQEQGDTNSWLGGDTVVMLLS
jgi:hypothetical protein